MADAMTDPGGSKKNGLTTTSGERQHLPVPYAWQRAAWQRICQQHADRKLPHALMLKGHKGVGKRHFARAVASLMLCLSPHNQMACGRCKGCDLYQAGSHPDLLLLHPEDKSRVIKIDQVRQLRDFIGKTAQQGGKKVVLLEPAESLYSNAANALLKNLEEPAGDTILLLVSDVPSQVMATIRSRCQQLDFAVPARDESLAWLQPLAVGHDAGYLLDCAGGAPLAALALLEGDTLEQRQSLAAGLLTLAEGRSSALELASASQQGEPLEVLEPLMQWLQAGLMLQAVPESPLPEDDTEAQLARLLAAVPGPILFRFWDKLVAVKRQLLSSANPNKQLLLEELMMDWQALCRQSTRPSQSGQRRADRLL